MASLLTIVFTDVVESSATKRELTLGRDSQERDHAYLEKIQTRYFNLVRECAAGHAGREVNTMGDAFYLAFENPIGAIRFARDIQMRLVTAPIETPLGPLCLRIGIHSGFPELFEDTYHGTDVDTAARIEGVATAQQVLLSSTTYELVRHMTDVSFERKGEFALKGLGRMALWEVKWDGKGPRPTAVPPLNIQERGKPTKLALVVLAAALVLIVSTLSFLLNWRHGRLPAFRAVTRVAVMPFRVSVSDPTLDFVTEGLSEGLSFRLSQLEGLRLASKAEIKQIANARSAEEVGRKLGFDSAIQGSVTGSLQQMTITASVQDLVHRRRMERVFIGGINDVIVIEDRMCAALASSLGLDEAYSEAKCRAVRPPQSLTGYQVYLEGREQMRKDHVDQALALYMKAVKDDSSFALAYTGIVDASLAKYQQTKAPKWLDEALNAALQAQKLNDNLPEVHFALGTVHAASGKADEAITEIKRGVFLAPTDEGFRRLGEAYQARGQLKDAIMAFRSAIEINPNYSNNFYRLGVALDQSGDSTQALVAFQHFKELDPDNPLADENIGTEYLSQGEYEKSIVEFKQAMAHQPDAETYSNLGLALFNLRRYSESVSAFQRAQAMNPNNATFVGNLADAYRWAGRKQDADRTYMRAIALAHGQLETNPRDADIMATIALYNAKTDHKDDALIWIRKARSLSPEDVGLQYDLAVIYALAGENAHACDTLREAVAKGYPEKSARSDPELSHLLLSKECDVFKTSKPN
jgi:tetratricopeptide (TPR) repeat protein/class 3 adenylate cyclase